MNPPAPQDAAVVYSDPAREGRPGLHALVVGVSAYPYLPERNTQPPAGGWPKKYLGLAQLDSAALGACRIARWLIAHADQLTPPLASVRLLLTPAAAEMGAAEGPAGLTVTNPTLGNLQAAAEAWRIASESHPDCTSLFYFAGHGVQRKIGDHVLLLHDFGRQGPMLNSALSTAELMNGMRLSAAHERRARRQLYFFDACQLRPEVFNDYEDLKTSLFWDVEAGESDDRQYGIFYATAPGHAAYGNVGGHSLFCEALLRCLDGGAAIPGAVTRPSKPSPWRVTSESLKVALGNHLRTIADAAGTTQVLGALILGPEFQLRTYATPPQVELEVTVDPSRATECAELALLSATRELMKEFDRPLPSNPHVIRVPAGGYIFTAKDHNIPRQYHVDPEEFIVHLDPPRQVIAIEFQSIDG